MGSRGRAVVVEAGDPREPKSNSRAGGRAVAGAAPLRVLGKLQGRQGRSPGGAAGRQGFNPGVVVRSGYFPLKREGERRESGPGGQCPWLVRLVYRERRRLAAGRRRVERGAEGDRVRGGPRGAAALGQGTRCKRAQDSDVPADAPSQTGSLRSKASEGKGPLGSRRQDRPAAGLSTGRGWGVAPPGEAAPRVAKRRCWRLWGWTDGETPLVRRTQPCWGPGPGRVETKRGGEW